MFVPNGWFHFRHSIRFTDFEYAKTYHIRLTSLYAFNDLPYTFLSHSIVAVHKPYIFTLGYLQPRIAGTAQSLIFLIDNMQIGMLVCKFSHYTHRIIGCTVVYHNHLKKVLVVLLTIYTLQCIPYVFLYFIDGDDDGELHIDTWCFFKNAIITNR